MLTNVVDIVDDLILVVDQSNYLCGSLVYRTLNDWMHKSVKIPQLLWINFLLSNYVA